MAHLRSREPGPSVRDSMPCLTPTSGHSDDGPKEEEDLRLRACRQVKRNKNSFHQSGPSRSSAKVLHQLDLCSRVSGQWNGRRGMGGSRSLPHRPFRDWTRPTESRSTTAHLPQVSSVVGPSPTRVSATRCYPFVSEPLRFTGQVRRVSHSPLEKSKASGTREDRTR